MWFLTLMKQLSCWNGAPQVIREEEKTSLTVSSVRNAGRMPASVRYVGEASASSPGTQVSSTPPWRCWTLCHMSTTPSKLRPQTASRSWVSPPSSSQLSQLPQTKMVSLTTAHVLLCPCHSCTFYGYHFASWKSGSVSEDALQIVMHFNAWGLSVSADETTECFCQLALDPKTQGTKPHLCLMCLPV